ncbi:hypothetical protein GCM10010206_60860 [Streptomyces cinerochromogenes]|nr:hypothetical protein GCM10010206_60860 [Streptomyces cinerochromogenes]
MTFQLGARDAAGQGNCPHSEGGTRAACRQRGRDCAYRLYEHLRGSREGTCHPIGSGRRPTHRGERAPGPGVLPSRFRPPGYVTFWGA